MIPAGVHGTGAGDPVGKVPGAAPGEAVDVLLRTDPLQRGPSVKPIRERKRQQDPADPIVGAQFSQAFLEIFLRYVRR